MLITKEATMLRAIVRQCADPAQVQPRYRQLVQALADDNMPEYYRQVRRLAPLTSSN